MYRNIGVKQRNWNSLADKKIISKIDWLDLKPDDRHTWITNDLFSEFTSLLPLGSKEAKLARDTGLKGGDIETVFKLYSLGVQTNRDNWVYDFRLDTLEKKVKGFIDNFNSEIDRWKRSDEPDDIDNFVIYDDTKLNGAGI